MANTVTSGSFSESGTIFVSPTMLDFGLLTVPPPGDQMASINLPTSGAFSGLTATEKIGIGNLDLAAATVTSTDINFDNSEPDWITLPDGIDLSLTSIPINTSVPVCSGTVSENMPGNECRAYATSPIVLEQGVTGVTALLNVEGDAYYTGSPSDLTSYSGKLSANFTGADGTISGLLSSFEMTGSVTTGYSGTFSTQASTIPEPATIPVLAAGFLIIAVVAKKKMKRTAPDQVANC